VPDKLGFAFVPKKHEWRRTRSNDEVHALLRQLGDELLVLWNRFLEFCDASGFEIEQQRNDPDSLGQDTD
jgi:hypothetical protein